MTTNSPAALKAVQSALRKLRETNRKLRREVALRETSIAENEKEIEDLLEQFPELR